LGREDLLPSLHPSVDAFVPGPTIVSRVIVMQDRSKEVSMRKVIVSEFVALDGVMENPGWA
jgi:hypothetical protein